MRRPANFSYCTFQMAPNNDKNFHWGVTFSRQVFLFKMSMQNEDNDVRVGIEKQLRGLNCIRGGEQEGTRECFRALLRRYLDQEQLRDQYGEGRAVEAGGISSSREALRGNNWVCKFRVREPLISMSRAWAIFGRRRRTISTIYTKRVAVALWGFERDL